MNPLLTVRGAIITGFILALIASFAVHQQTGFAELGLAVWIHILAGVMWIGLLYYFNVVQTPATVRRGPSPPTNEGSSMGDFSGIVPSNRSTSTELAATAGALL